MRTSRRGWRVPSPSFTPARFTLWIADCAGLRMPRSGSMPGTIASSLSPKIPIFPREVPCLAAHPRWCGCALATALQLAPTLCCATPLRVYALFLRVPKRAASSLRILVSVEEPVPSAEATVGSTNLDEIHELRVASKREDRHHGHLLVIDREPKAVEKALRIA